LWWTVTLFYRVLNDAKGRFKFEMRGLVFDETWLSFYLKPADGFQLPKIMQRVKQTFSFRFNVRTGRIGHLWGTQYVSRIVEAVVMDWGDSEGGNRQENPDSRNLHPDLEQP
jgi:hypothetical protein